MQSLRFRERLVLAQIAHQERRLAGLEDGDPDTPEDIMKWAEARLEVLRGWIDRLPATPG